VGEKTLVRGDQCALTNIADTTLANITAFERRETLVNPVLPRA
jgi:hypothetical protein